MNPEDASEPAVALDQTRAPYFQVLLDYVDAGVIPFHTPGHKQGIGMERAFRDFVGDVAKSVIAAAFPARAFANART